MTQEQKELLLKDLCARLPYGVKINNKIQGDFVVYGVCENYIFAATITKHGWVNHVDFNIEKIKPYLFPLSSMTEEQKKEYDSIIYSGVELHSERYYDVIDIDYFDDLMDFYHKHHLDYRGLIEKGLAIDATNLNIY